MQRSRRAFLGGVVGSAGAMLAAAACSKSRPASDARPPANEARKLGVALLGLGDYSATQLAPALERTRYCALRGIVTGTSSKVPAWQRKYGIGDRHVYDYASLARIANDPEIDIVYVVVPTSLHAKYAIAAAEAGKHVWCEKPMAMNVEECQSILDACRKNGVTLSISYRMQHEPNTRTVMELAKSKPYGSIQRIHASAGDASDGAPSWRMVAAMGGGALYDMGVYAINAIRYASGEEPVRVLRARQWTDRPTLFREVDENTEFELELPSGVVGYGKASRAQSDNELKVTCERGSYGLAPMQAYDGVKGEASDGRALDLTIDDQQRKQMDDDARAILERRPVMVPGEEGMRDIRFVQAIVRAAKSGAPVAL